MTPPNGQAERSGPSRPRRKPRWGRRVAIAAGVVLALLAALGALAPRIASVLGRPRAERIASDAIAGAVKIDRLSLSWGGPQVIGPLTLTDPQGRAVATVKAEVSAGLLGWARMSFDVGRVTVTGKADVVREADGQTNLQKAIAPTSPPAGGGGGGGGAGGGAPVRVPASLRGEVVLSNLEATLTDAAAPPGGVEFVAVRNLNGSAAFGAGRPATLSLSAEAAYRRAGAGQPGTLPAGTVKITATADNAISSAGVIDPGAVTVDARVEASRLAVAAADALAGRGGKLVAAVGETLDATLTLKGTAKDLLAEVKAQAQGVGADLGVRYSGDAVSVERPSVLRVRTEGVVGLVPALERALAEQKAVRVDAFPEATFTIDAARFNLPRAGALDLRGSGLSGTLAVGEAAATPLAGGEAYRLAPFNVRLDAPDLARGARVQARATATIGPAKAGELAIDIAASKVLDAAGAPRAMGPGALRGTARLTDLRTELAQPFVEAAGLRLAEDVGPVLNITLNAKGQGAADPAGGAAETDLELTVASQNVNGAFTATRTDTVLRPAGELRVARAGPLAARMLGKAGVAVATPTGVTLRIRDAAIDTARLAAAADAPDLGAVSGFLALEVEAASGTVALKPGETLEPWELAPTSLTVDATDLTRSAVAKLKTSATLAGQPAGLVDVEVIAAGLADAAARQGKPGQVNLRANIKGVATALVQKFIPAETLNLPRDIGPRIDLNAVANTRPNQRGAGPIPAAVLTLDVRSQNLSTGAKVSVADGAATLAEPLTLTIENTGGPASRFIPADLGYSFQQGGKTVVKLTEFTLPLEGDKPTPNLAKMAAAVGLTTTGLAVVPRQSGAVVHIDSLTVAIAQSPGADPALTLSTALRHQDQQGSLLADLSLRNLYGFKPGGGVSVTPARALPIGTVTIDLPTSLARLAGAAAPGQAAAPALDLAALVRDTVGPRVSIEMVSALKETPAGQPQSVDATLKVASEGVQAQATAVVNEARIDLAGANVKATVSPAAADRLLATFAPTMAPRPRLVEAVSPTLDAGPLRLPRTPTGGLNLARAGEAKVTAGVPGRVLLDRLVIQNADGTTRDLGAVGLEGVQLTAVAPLSALAPGAPAGEPSRATARLSAALLGANSEKIGSLVADLDTGLAAGRPAGPASAKVRVQNLQTAWIDAFAAQPGLVSGALGPNVSVEGEFKGVFDPPPAGSAGGGLRDGALTALLAASRIAMKEKATIALAADRLSVQAPPITWKMDPEWANRFLLRPPPGGAPAATFDRPADVTLAAKALTIGRGASGPLAPGVFTLDATVAIPAFQMGVKGQPIVMRDVAAAVRNGPDAGSLAFDVKAREQGGERSITITGTAAGLADARGALTPDAARVNADATVPGLATALIDALARQNGLLVEALGPEVSLQARARDLSKESGTIDATATAPNVTAKVAGRLEPGRFVATAPLTATLTRISPELASRLFKGSPVIGNFEKTAKDDPATLVVTGLTAPMNGDLRALNADVNFDPGTATFATGGSFTKILKFLDQRAQGQVGRRLDVLHIAVKEGVATYDRYSLPVGEFKIDTRGTVDLVGQQVDVITYIPLGALTDEAAGMINSGLGSAIGRAVPILEKATMIPWRTKGPMAEPKTSPDIGLLVQELGPNVLQGVGKTLEEVLRGIGGGGR